MCIIFEKNLSKTHNKINSTLTKIKKPTNYLPFLFLFNPYAKIFENAQSSYSPIVS